MKKLVLYLMILIPGISVLISSSYAQTALWEFSGFGQNGLGSSVSSGDVNGDGVADFIVGADGRHYINAGRVYVFSGSTGEILYNLKESGYLYGSSVSNAGDVNQDGFIDFVVGAWYPGIGGVYKAGSAYVYSGLTGQKLYEFSGEVIRDYFGGSVSGAGDVNRDGYDDLIIGAREADLNKGSAYVYSGINGSLLHKFSGTAWGDGFGKSVAGIGDINKDGYDDVVIGSYGADPNGLGSAGTAYVYSGKDYSLIYRFDGNKFNEQVGYSVANAGDTNNDGTNDIIIGTNYYDSIYPDNGAYVYSGKDGTLIYHVTAPPDTTHKDFGRVVSSAGDFNGDGFDDFIITSYREPVNEVNRGSGFIYSGKNGRLLLRLDGTMEKGFFGESVAPIGDLNQDGLDDIIVGAPGSFQESMTFVFAGFVPEPAIIFTSPNGGEALSAGTAHDITWESTDDIESVKIEYSADNGNSWTDIAASTENDGSYTWEVPCNPSDESLIRVLDVDGDPSDESDEVFSISCELVPGDLDSDGDVDYNDYLIFRTAYRSCTGDTNFIPGADLDGDGCVTINDYRIFRSLI